jgi:acyl-CoA thioesterase
MMTLHSFDQAVALVPLGDPLQGRWRGVPSLAYWNMVGPYGGITAATALQGLLQHPQRLGDPVACTFNYPAALSEAPVELTLRPVRTTRTTQHWTVEMTQPDAHGDEGVVLTGTVLTGKRRDTWGQVDHAMPEVPAPESVTQESRVPGVEWVNRYEFRTLEGAVPPVWNGQGEHSLSQVWIRDNPPRAMDFPSLLAMADFFYPRVWLRRGLRLPAGTVTMTVYFHADADELRTIGDDYLLGQAQAQVFHKGFFDQTAQLWSRSGHLLATSQQVMYFKD